MQEMNNSGTWNFDHQRFNLKSFGKDAAGEPHFLDMARRPAFAERAPPKLDLSNPIEAAEELFRELGLDRFLERRGLETEALVSRARAFVEKSPAAEADGELPSARTPGARRRAGARSDSGGSALPITGKPLPGVSGEVQARASEHASDAQELDMQEAGMREPGIDYVIDAPQSDHEAGAEEESSVEGQSDEADAVASAEETALLDMAGDMDNGPASNDPDFNDPAHVWTSEDIMMLILRDEVRAAEIAAHKQALAAEAYAAAEAAHYAEAA